MKIDLVLVPRDGFFCKDGRGWMTSESGRARILDWPPPSVLVGTLRSAWGRTQETLLGTTYGTAEWLRTRETVRLGATVAMCRSVGAGAPIWSAAHRRWPVPLDAIFLTGATHVTPLRPRETPESGGMLGRDDDPAREGLWWPSLDDRAKPVAPPRWWSDADFVAWLCERRVSIPTVSNPHRGAPARRMETHVGIDGETGAAREGVLWSAEVVETRGAERSEAWEWAVAVAGNIPEGTAQSVQKRWVSESFLLGGGGRLARAERVDPTGVFSFPDLLRKTLPDTGLRGIRLMAVTPVVSSGGWVPPGFVRRGDRYVGGLPGIAGELVLRAAFVGRPSHFSGWDVAGRSPKTTRRCIPAGSVFFIERVAGGGFTSSDLERLWFAEIGEDTADGWGRVVAGHWHQRA